MKEKAWRESMINYLVTYCIPLPLKDNCAPGCPETVEVATNLQANELFISVS